MNGINKQLHAVHKLNRSGVVVESFQHLASLKDLVELAVPVTVGCNPVTGAGNAGYVSSDFI